MKSIKVTFEMNNKQDKDRELFLKMEGRMIKLLGETVEGYTITGVRFDVLCDNKGGMSLSGTAYVDMEPEGKPND